MQMNRTVRTLIAGFLLALPSLAGAELVSGIAALVNDEVITILELNREIGQIQKEGERKSPTEGPTGEELRKAALNRIIDRRIVEQKIRELDIRISEEEVRQAIEDVKKQNKLTQENLVSALAAQGLSFDQYKAQMKDQLERLRLVSQEVRAKIQVGEREMQEFYEANQAKYRGDETFRARHILFRMDKGFNSQQVKDAMNRAMNALLEVKSGKDFAELARQYSDDPAAKKDGGDLGTFKKGDMLPEMEDALAKLNPGETSELIYTPAGLHIIKFEERIPGRPRPFEEVKGEIEDIIYRKKSEERFSQWVEDLKKNAVIEIRQ